MKINGKLRETELILTRGANKADTYAGNLAKPITISDVYAYGGAPLRAGPF